MQDIPEEEPAADNDTFPIGNSGEPILLTDVNMHGILAEPARGGEEATVWTRLVLTSDQALFHRVIGNLAEVVEHRARKAGAPVALRRATTVLLVIRPDNSAELWIDSAAMMVYSALKRPGNLKAGTVLFENDIADVSGIWFPLVEIGAKDRVLCILREGWRFGLLVDFNSNEDLSIENAKRDLGSMYRQMRYADLYAALAHAPTFGALVAAGWFPFLELMSGEFGTLLGAQEAGFELDDSELALVEKFDDARVERMFARWMERAHLKDKEAILRSAINAFKAKDPVSVIKNVLTEIEGVMAEAYFKATGKHTHRIKELLPFIVTLAEKRAGGKDTLFFPVEFATYLRDYIYAGFAPGDQRTAGSRNAVGHGAVAADKYTMTCALQALLALDQLAFYIGYAG